MSELFYRAGPFIRNVSFVETQKNIISSKLVNNYFNGAIFDGANETWPIKFDLCWHNLLVCHPI